MSSNDTTQISNEDVLHLNASGDNALLISVNRAAGNFTDILITNGSVVSISLYGRLSRRRYSFKVNYIKIIIIYINTVYVHLQILISGPCYQFTKIVKQIEKTVHSTALHRTYPLLKNITEIAQQDITYQQKLDTFNFKTLDEIINSLENSLVNEKKNDTDRKKDE